MFTIFYFTIEKEYFSFWLYYNNIKYIGHSFPLCFYHLSNFASIVPPHSIQRKCKTSFEPRRMFLIGSDKIIILFRMSTPSLLGAFQILFCGFFLQSEGGGTPHSTMVLTKETGIFGPKNTIVSTFQPFLVHLQPFWSILTPFGAKYWGS